MARRSKRIEILMNDNHVDTDERFEARSRDENENGTAEFYQPNANSQDYTKSGEQ